MIIHIWNYQEPKTISSKWFHLNPKIFLQYKKNNILFFPPPKDTQNIYFICDFKISKKCTYHKMFGRIIYTSKLILSILCNLTAASKYVCVHLWVHLCIHTLTSGKRVVRQKHQGPSNVYLLSELGYFLYHTIQLKQL